MSVYIAKDPRDKKALKLAAQGEPAVRQVRRFPLRRAGAALFAFGITFMVMFPLLGLLVPPSPKSHGIVPKEQLAQAVAPLAHILSSFATGIGLLSILGGGFLLFVSLFVQSVQGPSLADQQLGHEFKKAVTDGRLTEVHPEIIAGATTWAREHGFQIITGSATDASLARNIYEAEAEDRRGVLDDLIARHIAVLEKARAGKRITRRDRASLDDVVAEFEKLSQLSIGDVAPIHIQQIMALHAAIIRMLAPQVELLNLKGVSRTDKANIRRDLREWGAWMAKTEQALMAEHPTDDAIRAELAHDMVVLARSLTPTAE